MRRTMVTVIIDGKLYVRDALVGVLVLYPYTHQFIIYFILYLLRHTSILDRCFMTFFRERLMYFPSNVFTNKYSFVYFSKITILTHILSSSYIQNSRLLLEFYKLCWFSNFSFTTNIIVKLDKYFFMGVSSSTLTIFFFFFLLF